MIIYEEKRRFPGKSTEIESHPRRAFGLQAQEEMQPMKLKT